MLFWIISVIALLWNLMGCFQWFAQYNMWKNPASRENLPEAMQGIFDQQPEWTYAVFAIAVITGTLGCIGLLMRKSWASTLFLISLITVVFLQLYYLTTTDALEKLGPSSLFMPSMVILFAVFLLYYSKKSTAQGILN